VCNRVRFVGGNGSGWLALARFSEEEVKRDEAAAASLRPISPQNVIRRLLCINLCVDDYFAGICNDFPSASMLRPS
jgi:hypothetical protein